MTGVRARDPRRPPSPKPAVAVARVRDPAAGGAPLRLISPSLGNHATSRLLSGAAGGRRRLQRWPGEAIDRARARVSAELDYHRRTAQLDFALGRHLSRLEVVHQVADELLGRLKRVVDAWAEATRQDRMVAYGTIFSFPEGQRYYGSFKTTGGEIKSILDDIAHQPLRHKLNLVYYAARNNAFAMLLETAAVEIRREHLRLSPAPAPLEVDEHISGATRAVQSGFAKRSGFAEMWDEQARSELGEGDLTPEQITDIVMNRPQSAQRPLVGTFSPALSSQLPARTGRPDKRYTKSVGLGWEDQPTLTRADVPDITIRELELLHERRETERDALSVPSASELEDKRARSVPSAIKLEDKRARFASKPGKPVRWETGVGGIEVLPASVSRRIAERLMARIDGGISGSADLMLHVGIHLGLRSTQEKERLRLALVAWMLANRDHSLHEILAAAAGYGVALYMDQGRPGSEYEDHRNFAPLPAAVVEGFRKLVPDGVMPGEVLAPKAVERAAVQASEVRRQSTQPAPDEAKLLAGLAVDPSQLAHATSAEFVAHHEMLTSAVDHAGFGDPSSEAGLVASRRALQTLRDHWSFQWLAIHHADAPGYAEREVERLVRVRRPGALVSAAELELRGIPPLVAQAAMPIQRLDLARLALAAVTIGARLRSPASAPARLELRATLAFAAVKRHEDIDADGVVDALARAFITTQAKL